MALALRLLLLLLLAVALPARAVQKAPWRVQGEGETAAWLPFTGTALPPSQEALGIIFHRALGRLSSVGGREPQGPWAAPFSSAGTLHRACKQRGERPVPTQSTPGPSAALAVSIHDWFPQINPTPLQCPVP